MLDFWDANIMDFLLLLFPIENAVSYQKSGDFVLLEGNIISRPKNNSLSKYIYTGVCLANTRKFTDISKNIFSINKLWDIGISKKRVYGIVHKGNWFHVGTPEELSYAEKILNNA